MKYIIITMLLFLVIPFVAQAAAGHGGSLEDVLSEVLAQQNVSSVQDIDCSNVSQDQFEELGDAWMGEIHPDPDTHAMMDSMMGGEGSDSLRAAHIQMGQNAVGCSSQTSGSIGAGMMNGTMGMMGGGMGGFSSMMGGLNPFVGSWMGLGWIISLVWWALIIIAIVFFVRWLMNRGSGNALDELKKRYAKGSITRDEYEKIKKDITN